MDLSAIVFDDLFDLFHSTVDFYDLDLVSQHFYAPINLLKNIFVNTFLRSGKAHCVSAKDHDLLLF